MNNEERRKEMSKMQKRQKIILKLIAEWTSSSHLTQNMIAKLLDTKGITCTQATISRDVKDLMEKKIIERDTDGQYSISRSYQIKLAVNKLYEAKASSFYSEAWACFNNQAIVVKTQKGFAETVGSLIEEALKENIAFITGVQTVLVIPKQPEEIQGILDIINSPQPILTFS